MTSEDGSVESLRDRIRQLESELTRQRQTVIQLEKINKDQAARLQDQGDNSADSSNVSEMEETLRRMLTRIAMIVQGGKCLFLMHDTETNELFAEKPAIGFDDVNLKDYRVSVQSGVSGEAFRTGHSVIFYDAETDDRAREEGLAARGVRNGVCVPLVIVRRDEETDRVIDQRTIGVIHVFNKRYGGIFVDDDVKLLDRMATNTAKIINSAESYRKIVRQLDVVVETIESLYAGLLMINKNGRITQMNASARQIFGLTADDVSGSKPFDQVIKDEKTREILTRALAEDGGVQEEVTLPNPSNPEIHHVFQIQSALVRNDVGEQIGMVAIFNDITELRNVDKMKTAFVSTVSHELRTPLTSIKGFVSTMLQDTEGFYDNEMRQEFYTIIDTECDRLRRLIDDLLNVSRIESKNPLPMHITEFDVRKTLEREVRTQTASTYKKEAHSISFEIDPDVPETITADDDKIQQIFANLIGNALKYSPKGGEVKISGRMMPGGEMMQFAISDHGMGIPKEHLAKMFQRFHRVDNRDTREIGGTGIGLFLVKALVELHHGRIWLDSEHGKGTTFYFTLPVRQPDEDDGPSLASKISA